MIPYIILIILNLPSSPHTCSATSFGQPGDKHGGRTPTLLYKRPVGPQDMGIAHRTWPMGARIKITHSKTGVSALGVVLDRGTWGMRDSKGWFNSRKTKNKRRGKQLYALIGEKAYCGCADITYGLAQVIGHRGRDLVTIELLGK